MVVSSPDLKAFLSATPFFGGLSDASLALLTSMLVERRFDIGATVVAEGEPGRSMFIVHSGELVVNKRAVSGGVIRMTGLGPGDFFGEMTLIEMQNRSATVIAESPAVLYELTARQLYTYYKADIHAYVMVLQNISRELCRRLRRADDRTMRNMRCGRPRMLAWSAALALVAILALFVPRRQLLLLGIAAVAGIATPGLFDWRGSQGLVQMIWLIFSLCFANGHEGNRSNQT